MWLKNGEFVIPFYIKLQYSESKPAIFFATFFAEKNILKIITLTPVIRSELRTGKNVAAG
jgi:hypothetical protein